MALWTILYTILSCIYRFVLVHDTKNRQYFELICIYAARFTKLIPPPIAFLTGFYVTQVVSRWWDQFMSLPWPDSLAIKLANFCPGTVSNNNNIHTKDTIYLFNKYSLKKEYIDLRKNKKYSKTFVFVLLELE